MYVCMYVCMHACMHACMDGWMYVCIYIYIYLQIDNACVYICIKRPKQLQYHVLVYVRYMIAVQIILRPQLGPGLLLESILSSGRAV